ncbi:MAG TPA: PQQ-binding-like beta-propeller repeat protein, partial [Candidatus Nanoarchaeia archaeon]|nr:PQQ-binding-like beta-propeller repeat protein [Candidatus Nanoarchaeia archaeon]
TDYSYDPTSANVNDSFLPSHATATLTVVQQQVAPPLSYSLPTTYWTRPISGQNTAWATAASNFLYPNVAAYQFGAVRYVPGVAAPSSGHIMWTDPIQFGGYTGANSPDNVTVFYDGRSYEDRFSNPIIISGNLYFALPLGSFGGARARQIAGAIPVNNGLNNGGYVDINLETGQQVWKQNYLVDPSFGVMFNTVNPNQDGAVAYLIAVSGTTWIGYDAYTGLWLFNITNVPSGWAGNYGPNGEPEIYTIHVAPTGNWLALWNFTDVLMNGNANYLAATNWAPNGIVADTNTRLSYSWNVTLPTLPSGSTVKWAIDGNLLLGANIPSNQFGGITAAGVQNPQSATFFALSLKPGTLGQLIWQQTYTTPGNLTFQLGQVDPTNNVFIMSTKETMQWYGFSLTTGNQLWGPLGNPTAFNYYSTIGQGSSADVGYIAYGNFYVGGYGGIIYCYNDANGALEWTYGNGGAGNSTNSGFNTPYGNYPTFVGLIADGMVYVYNGNHGNGVPLYNGYTLSSLNATNGALLWSEQSGVEVGGFEDYQIPVADGNIAYFNAFDGQVYCLGKGPSATSIETPLEGIPQGGRLMIQGTVKDIAPGTKQTQQAADFPNGVPCVSDASESAWMQYVYMQYPMPTDATGVQVTLTAIDPNGNNILLGNTATDSSGLYSLEVNSNLLGAGPGVYKVTATFAGSNSYWGSSAESTFVIAPAITTSATSATSPNVSPTQTPPPSSSSSPTTPTPTIAPSPSPVVIPPTSNIPIATYIAIAAVVVIIVVVAAALLLRRRK